MGAIESFTNNIGSAAAGAGMGLLVGQAQNNQNYNYASSLQSLGIEGQKEMASYNKNLALEMYNDTWKANIENMEKYGFNKGLMMKSTGAGGITASNPGNVNTPTPGNRNVSEGMAMMMGNQLTAAQIENIKADTAKKEVEAAKTAGADTRNTEANTALTEINAGIAAIQKSIAENTETDQIVKIQAEAGKLRGEMNKAIADGTIAQDTIKTQIQKANADLIGTYIDNTLNRAKTIS